MADPTGISGALLGAVVAKLLDQVIIETKKVVNCKRDSSALLKLLETIQPLVLLAAKDVSTRPSLQLPANVSIRTENETSMPGTGLGEGLVDVEEWLENLGKRLEEAKGLVSECNQIKSYEFRKLHKMSGRIATMRDQIAEICTIEAPLALLNIEVGTAQGVEKTLEVLALLSADVGTNMREITEWMAKLAETWEENRRETREQLLKLFETVRRPEPSPRAGSPVHVIRSELLSNGTLLPGESLVSESGEYTFINQHGDGNLVTYTKFGTPIWASDTGPSSLRRGGELKLLTDGNLVLFNTMDSTREPFWASMSQGEAGPYKIVLQDDGNLVIYGSLGATWASLITDTTSLRFISSAGNHELPSGVSWLQASEMLVSKNKMYKFVNQADGNLCIYRETGQAIRTEDCVWASGTYGHGYRGNLYMQRNGNLVLHNTEGDGASVWSSATSGRGTGPYELVMEDDGNLVIYDAQQTIIWAVPSCTPAVSRGRFISSAGTHKLPSGVSWLQPNEMLVSREKLYKFVNQGDGNLCIYRETGEVTRTEDCVWASNTYWQGYKGNLYMHRDGNLVLYNTEGDGAAVWSSATSGSGTGPYKLVMQDDGNLVIYDAQHTIIWAVPSGAPAVSRHRYISSAGSHELRSNEMLVSPNKLYKFVNQADGNLCIYRETGQIIRTEDCVWASGTHWQGYKGNLSMQRDGNLVLYNTEGDGAGVWASATSGKGTGPYELVMQDDGNLVIYDAQHTIIWAVPSSTPAVTRPMRSEL